LLDASADAVDVAVLAIFEKKLWIVPSFLLVDEETEECPVPDTL
jgi:hypothetical protein